MARWVRTCVPLAEDTGTVPSSHINRLAIISNSYFRGPPPSGLCCRCMHMGTLRHTHVHLNKILKITNKSFMALERWFSSQEHWLAALPEDRGSKIEFLDQPSSGLRAPGTHVVHRHTCRQNYHTHSLLKRTSFGKSSDIVAAMQVEGGRWSDKSQTVKIWVIRDLRYTFGTDWKALRRGVM